MRKIMDNIILLESREDFDSIHGDGSDAMVRFYYKDLQFTVYGRKNDIYGTPTYKINISQDYKDITEELKGKVYRVYKSKRYVLIHAFNLSDTLYKLMEQLTRG